MPAQHTQESGRPAIVDEPTGIARRRRAWLVALLGLVVVVATVVVVLDRTSAHPTAGAAPVDVAAASSMPDAPTVAPTSPSASVRAVVSTSASPSATKRRSPSAQAAGGWPNASNTGVPRNVRLHRCGTTISAPGTYDRCRFDGSVTVKADHVRITRSLIKGQVDARGGASQRGLVISDTTIDCGCLSDDTHAPAAILDSNYTLRRVHIRHAGHGAVVKNNVVIEDSYIHELGANTDAHKDGVYSGDGSHVVLRHNTIECNDGSRAGCTAAIGLLTDFGTISHYTIERNLLNTNGAYCIYGSGGRQKAYTAHHIVVRDNHFGRSVSSRCGAYGPVTYFDVKAPGNQWRGNVWHDSGKPVPAQY